MLFLTIVAVLITMALAGAVLENKFREKRFSDKEDARKDRVKSLYGSSK